MTSRELLDLLLTYKPVYVKVKWAGKCYCVSDIRLLTFTRCGVLLEATESLTRTYVVPSLIFFLKQLSREHPVKVCITSSQAVVDVVDFSYTPDTLTLCLECTDYKC